MSKEKFRLLIKYLFIPLLISLVFARSLFYPFIMDDEEQIVYNNIIKQNSFLWQSFLGSTYSSGGMENLTGLYYRPLSIVIYGVVFGLWNLNPFGYHLFQIVFHLLNTFLVFLLFKKFFSGEKLKYATEISGFLTLVFAIHPINVEPVVFISAQETFYTFLTLLTIYFFSVKLNSQKNSLLLFLLYFFLILIGLLAKESAAVIILLGFVYFLLYQKDKFFLFFSSSLFSVLSYFVLRLYLAKIPFTKNSVFPLANSPLTIRLLHLPSEFLFYLKTYFYPLDLIINQQWMFKNVTWESFCLPFILSAGILFFLIYLCIKLKSKLVIFFTCWFLLSLSLVLNIIPADATVADRWFYFPQIGFLGILGIILSKLLFRYYVRRTILIITSAVIISLLVVRSVIRVDDWQNGLILFQRDIVKNDQSFDLPNNLGVMYFRLNQKDKAREYFEKSISIAPDWWISYFNQGIYYESIGNYQKAKEAYEKSIKNGNYYLAFQNLSFLLLRNDDKKEALSFIQNAVSLMPSNNTLIKALCIAYYLNKNQDKAEKWVKYLYAKEPSSDNRKLLETILNKGEIKL